MIDFKKIEQEVLDFWKKNQIYQKSKQKNKNGEKFYFMDGPPYATGHIHMGTALNKILKDITMRSRRLQGYDVFDRPGYDTHGLPIEHQIEKEIGSKSKKDIEKYGVKKFIEKCKEYATKYIDVMNSDFSNLGVWMDWDNPYLSLHNNYVASVWDVIKTAAEKNLFYLGKYPVHLCPRCETAVAYNEIEYTKKSDTSVFVKFPLKDKEDTFLVIWTTTPWTLPSNTGIMVHPEVDYQEIETSRGERWIIAKELVNNLLGILERSFSVRKEFKGKEMKGWIYENPLADNIEVKVNNGYKVVLSGRYVTTEEGTGLVHCAPGHGKEDYEVGKENGLDMPCPIASDGTFTGEAGKYAGKKVIEANEEIVKDLEEKEFLVYKYRYNHDYPICWRCKSALLMVSQPQWFLKISDIHKKLLEENEKTNWVPSWMELRMKAWLEGIGDWPISRERYWGTPLPIWICDKCEKQKIIGSIEELEEVSGQKVDEVHKPEIDEVKFPCKDCEGEMKRIESVFDVWFDSGVSSWAALGYPCEKEKFDKFWPADVNIEGNDQFRGWWNSQLILSMIKFGKKPFENIAVHGMVLDVEKKKMSKSLGNIVAPKDVIEKFGRDAMRYYFAKLSKGEDFAYDEKEFREISNVFRALLNVNRFIDQLDKKEQKERLEDKWILSRFYSMLKKIKESLGKYRFYEAVNLLEEFLIKDVSRTYIQMIRERNNEVYKTLNEIRIGLIKLFAPITPFYTESIWKNLKENGIVDEESVHLSSWPEVKEDKIDLELEKHFSFALQAIEKGLSRRDKEGISLRWPLAKAVVVYDKEEEVNPDLGKIISRQLNVKKVDFQKGSEIKVELDTELTLKLEAEGFAREISRRVQAERKKRGMKKEDSIRLTLSMGSELGSLLKNYLDFIRERTGSEVLNIVDKKTEKMIGFEVRNKQIGIDF